MDILNFAKSVPEWMNESFFDKVIRHMERDPQAKVLEFDVKAGSNPGDNFASSIFKSLLKFKSKFTKNETKTISVIIKCQMAVGVGAPGMSDFLTESPLFRNEMEMYGEVLPQIQSLWLSAGDKDFSCPK